MLGALAYFLFIYLLGGLTLIPGLVVLLFRLAKTRPDDEQSTDFILDRPADEPDELEKEEETGVDSFMTAWIIVSRDYFVYPTGDPKNSQIPPLQAANDASMQQNEGAYSKLYTLMSNSHGSQQKETNQFDDTESGNVKKKSPSNLKKYFAVLKHGNILLYLDSDQAKLKYVIVIANHVVTMWPPDIPDGELFIKRTAICLAKKDSPEGFEMLTNYESTGIAPKDAFYIYSDSCTEKEDFYFAIIRAAKQSEAAQNLAPAFDPTISAVPYHYRTNEMMDLIVKLHSSDANLQTRWLNAILGRLFLAVKGTGFFEDLVEQKLIKKLSRVKRPGFLGELEVRKITVGSSVPFFTNPKLRDLTPEGLLIVDANISYSGGISVEIATKMILNLGARFKTRDVSLLLAVTLDSLDGKIQLKIKPPPSNRFWFGFVTMPKLNFHVEPVVSSKQITYSMVTNVIENRIREVFKETLVLPNMDDISFSNTMNDFYRGGIWDKSAREPASTADASTEPIDDDIDVSSIDIEEESNTPTNDTSSILGSSAKFGKKISSKSSALLKRTKTSLTSSSSANDLARKSGDNRSVTSSANDLARKNGDNRSVISSQMSDDARSLTSSSDVNTLDKETSSHIGELRHSPTTSTRGEESSTSAPKKDIMNAMKKWGSWYFKDKNEKSTEEPSAIVQQHRRRSSTSAKAAPLPHNFPPEILQFLREEEESGRNPYGRVDMQIPPILQSKPDLGPKRTNTVMRKPVGSSSRKEPERSESVPIPNSDDNRSGHQSPEPLVSSSASSDSARSNHSNARMPSVSLPTNAEDTQGILLKPTTAAPVVNPSPANSSPTFDATKRVVPRKKVGASNADETPKSPSESFENEPTEESQSTSAIDVSDDASSMSSVGSGLLDSAYLDEVDPSTSIVRDSEEIERTEEVEPREEEQTIEERQ